MEILIDADVVIEAERGKFPLFDWMKSRPYDDFKLASITVAELWHGVERASFQYRQERQLFLETLFAMMDSVPYSRKTALEHASLWAMLETRGTMIGAHDLILAAIALEHGSIVATFNRRHFAAVPNLQIITPEII